MTGNHYATLGIARTASPEEIKRAYRHLAKRLHPDRDPSPRAMERFIQVQHAYETLRDPLLRIAYDARTREPMHRDPRYRPAKPMTLEPVMSGPDIRVRSWAFLGLHITGLVFGIALITGLITGVSFRGWPLGALLFMLPGLLVLPDAWRGIRMWKAGMSRRSPMREAAIH